jgi:hypothetical protein
MTKIIYKGKTDRTMYAKNIPAFTVFTGKLKGWPQAKLFKKIGDYVFCLDDIHGDWWDGTAYFEEYQPVDIIIEVIDQQ